MPPFHIKVIGSFRDCLTRHVAEALKIHNSKDELLNSNNEYASNHLSRIVVDMDTRGGHNSKKLKIEYVRPLM